MAQVNWSELKRVTVRPPRLPGKPIHSTDDMTLLETLVGLAGLFILCAIIYGIWALFWVGRPASVLMFLFLVAGGVFSLLADMLKAPKDIGLWRSLLAGIASDTCTACLWTAIGMLLIWLAQLTLYFLPDIMGAEQGADIQLWIYDLADGLKASVGSVNFLLALGVAMILSIVAGTVWPITAASKAKKWVGIAAAICAAFSTMSFVAIRSGSDRYEENVIGPIRAQIAADLDCLRVARQQHAALRWLRESVREQMEQAPQDRHVWQNYLTGGAALCREAQQRFTAGYDSYARAMPFDRTIYCDPADYVATLADSQLHRPSAVRTDVAEPTRWLPDFSGFGLSEHRSAEGAPVLAISTVPRRLAELRKAEQRVRTIADQEEKARNAVQSAIVSVIAGLLPANDAGLAGAIVDKLRERVLEAVVQDSRARAALWLRLIDARPPRPVAAVLGIEPELELRSPQREMSRAGGGSTIILARWQRDHIAMDKLSDLGRTVAISDRATMIARQQEDARMAAYLKENARKIGIERGKGHH